MNNKTTKAPPALISLPYLTCAAARDRLCATVDQLRGAVAAGRIAAYVAADKWKVLWIPVRYVDKTPESLAIDGAPGRGTPIVLKSMKVTRRSKKGRHHVRLLYADGKSLDVRVQKVTEWLRLESEDSYAVATAMESGILKLQPITPPEEEGSFRTVVFEKRSKSMKASRRRLSLEQLWFAADELNVLQSHPESNGETDRRSLGQQGRRIREKHGTLGAALAIIALWPKKVLDKSGKLSINEIVRLIEANPSIVWASGQAPVERDTMKEHLVPWFELAEKSKL